MIDFRYHVVSLVAVFLALATGIVIGGFSLRGEVADQLNGQVVQLRKDKSELQNQVNQASIGGRKRDEGVAEVAPKVLAGALADKRVAIVALPDTDDALVKSVKQTVGVAGGTVTTTVSLKQQWITPQWLDSEQVRTDAAKVGIDAKSVPAERLAGAVLARSLVRPAGQEVLRDLAGSDAASVSPQTAPVADAVVVVWPGMVDKDGVVKKWSASVSGMGISVDAVVGVSSGSAPSDGGSKPDALVTSLRDTPEVVSVMSTIDDGSIPIGQVGLGLAVRDELAGRSGQYGMGRDASAVVPRVSPESTPGATP